MHRIPRWILLLLYARMVFMEKCIDVFGRLKRNGTTGLFVSHDLGLAQKFCDRVMVLSEGRMINQGEPQP